MLFSIKLFYIVLVFKPCPTQVYLHSDDTLNVVLSSPYLNASKREILADYALPASVIIMAFFGSFIFRDVKCECFLASV